MADRTEPPWETSLSLTVPRRWPRTGRGERVLGPRASRPRGCQRRGRPRSQGVRFESEENPRRSYAEQVEDLVWLEVLFQPQTASPDLVAALAAQDGVDEPVEFPREL